MHEYAITKELLRIAREKAKENNLSFVKKIFLELGVLSGYEEDSIRYYFDELKMGGDYLRSAELIVNESVGNEIKITSITGEKNGD